MRRRTRAREYALQILYQIDMTGDPAHVVLSRFWQNKNSDPEVISFTDQLVKGASDKSKEIDAIIVAHSEHWRIDRIAAIDRNILRLAIYELLYRVDIPPKVTINEAVDMAHKYSTPDSGKFINGILDKLININLSDL